MGGAEILKLFMDAVVGRSYAFNYFKKFLLIWLRGMQFPPSFLNLEQTVICRIIKGPDSVGNVLVAQDGPDQLCFDDTFQNSYLNKLMFICVAHFRCPSRGF